MDVTPWISYCAHNAKVATGPPPLVSKHGAHTVRTPVHAVHTLSLTRVLQALQCSWWINRSRSCRQTPKWMG